MFPLWFVGRDILNRVASPMTLCLTWTGCRL
ncbi:hypothetical protein CY0110_16517 [Crocosphaera chwakensis CCY0110]|uniref:Uncharacterized protein n=1 Tax=Crocosphaera chwakensis CCY0110 TaxID=391612 RepID=A3IHY5_9CHRO|nr:hypothetical protein CY0110_16517 [Crocosphaera chwakensis CCY0110]